MASLLTSLLRCTRGVHLRRSIHQSSFSHHLLQTNHQVAISKHVTKAPWMLQNPTNSLVTRMFSISACRHLCPVMNNSLLLQQKQQLQQPILGSSAATQKRSKVTLTRALRRMRSGKSKTRTVREKKYYRRKERQRKHAILHGPFRKGVVTRLLVRPPRRPNSAARKIAFVKLNDGRGIQCFIPGPKSNLSEHDIVLIRGGKTQDTPGLKYKIVRKKYDCN